RRRSMTKRIMRRTSSLSQPLAPRTATAAIQTGAAMTRDPTRLPRPRAGRPPPPWTRAYPTRPPPTRRPPRRRRPR
ncbi:unnamed protein product, partial [Prorocentrum cordatum]